MMDEHEALGALVRADEVAGEPQTFTLTRGGSGFAFAGHPGWPEDAQVPTDVLIDEMESRGWLRVTHREGVGRHFALTGDGRREWGRWNSLTGSAVDLSWSAARRVLHQIYEKYEAAGAPVKGVDVFGLFGDGNKSAHAAVAQLARAGYLDVSFESAAGISFVIPSTQTLQLEAGWPTGVPAEDALAELVEALDTELAQTSDQEKRSKLIQVRDGLIGAARDVALAYLEKKIGAT
jgi:hypothetical protein